MSSQVTIVPSALSADFAAIGEDLRRLEKGGADRVQWDVMDNHFVPNLTFGPDVIAANRSATDLPFEAHLMVSEPERLLQGCVAAGCSLVIVHAEACTHLHRVLGQIHELGAAAGVALNPATPVEHVRHVLDLVDLLLVMTVNPGFGGQRYLASMEPKIEEASALLATLDRHVELEVDGGISPATVGGAVGAGARVLVAGSAVFSHPDGPGAGIDALRLAAEAALTSPPAA
jgi:ribulose-phosphate 3-epimerase